jgi:hypothetical protein
MANRYSNSYDVDEYFTDLKKGLFSEIPVAELVSQTWHDKDSRYRDTRG